MTTYFLLPFSFLMAFVICRFIIVVSNRKQWLDHPNSRSSHVRPTPTGGGIGILASFFACALVMFYGAAPGFNLYLILAPSLMIAGIGLADDFYSLGIWSRLAVQLLAVCVALAVFGIPSLPVMALTVAPGPVGYVLAAIGFLWFINLFNFMDGIDGLAATETLFFCLALYGIALAGREPALGQLVLLLTASVAGFLVLNLPPARIFMGDVGSNFLGFLLGVITLAVSVTGITSLWTCLILAGVFIVDATWTLASRWRQGEKWYFAHRSHAYQRAADALGSHGKAVSAVFLINVCWLLPLAYFAHHFPGNGLLLMLIAWLPLGILAGVSARFGATGQPA